MEKRVSYKSTGYVLGNYWGGGTGAYPSKVLTADSKEELLEKAKKSLSDGSLDSGMGYESLIGAVLNIVQTTTVEIDGKDFHNEETHVEIIGELSDDEEEFLLELA